MVSDPAARAVMTATATGLDANRLDARRAERKADIEVEVLRGTQAAPPWVRAAVHSEPRINRGPSPTNSPVPKVVRIRCMRNGLGSDSDDLLRVSQEILCL
ncbi:hypothetical protein GCM10023100_22010 [Actinocorallia cavernae]|uniref:Uncharacterized protein n=2 Tax=Actinomycetes TaxID=1760 RepID=A0ABN3MI24_9ACTN